VTQASGNTARLDDKLISEFRKMLNGYPDISLVKEGANALDNARMSIDQYLPRRRMDTGTRGVMGVGMGCM